MRRLLIFSLLAVLVACSDSVYYEQSYVIQDGQWAYEDVAKFEFEVESIESYYDLVLQIKHDADYTYENLYVKINTIFPSGEEVTDQVSLQLADQLDQWQGKCSGSTCMVDILLQEKIRFKESGKHQISIEQFNRENPTIGIQKLTLKILPVAQ